MPASKWYAVRHGRMKGIFRTWPECQDQVSGFSGAIYKSFRTLGEAEDWLGPVGNNKRQHPGSWEYADEPPRGSRQQPRQYDRQPPSNHYGHDDDEDDDRPANQPTRAPPRMGTIGVLLMQPLKQARIEAPGRPAADTVLDCCLAYGRDVHWPPGMVPSSRPGAYRMNFDGASRDNPGAAGCGAIIVDTQTGAPVVRLACPLPYGCTNNEAEYAGLIMGLQACASLGIKSPLVQGDSNLVVQQVNGNWQVRTDGLKPYVAQAQGLVNQLSGGGRPLKLQHVYRDANTEADELSNQAVDMQGQAGNRGFRRGYKF